MEQKGFRRFDSVLLKGIIVIILTLLMLIPINMVMSLIEERSKNKNEVTEEITSKWGGEQTITGPILVIPYQKQQSISTRRSGATTEESYKTTIEYAYLLPEEYNTTSKTNVEERSRSIYSALVYQSENKLKGSFDLSKIKELKIGTENILWDEVSMILGVTYMQGISNKVMMNINGKDYEATPGIPYNTMVRSGLTTKVPIDWENGNKQLAFNINLNLNGSEKLHIAPIGKENKIEITSDWNTVSFSGDILPSKRDITKEGIDAEWNIFDYNRNYVQLWTGENRTQIPEVGVELRYSVDQYQMSMRSVKYAILFIALTFVIFFFVEIITRRKIHPIQYALVSLALITFYTLLIAFSEHIGFHFAYLISSIAIVVMITLYTNTFLKKKVYALAMGGFVSLIYIYLYVILQLEDLSLLIGAVGLFIALAAIMYASRKIDWYKDADENKNVNDIRPIDN